MSNIQVARESFLNGNATPIARISPDISDQATRVVDGIITITWPFSIVTKSIAFVLAERDPRLRREKGQIRIRFHGAAARAISDAGIGGGDEIRVSLEGVKWEKNETQLQAAGTTLGWQMEFTNRLLLSVRKSDEEPKIIDVTSDGSENGVVEDPVPSLAPSVSEDDHLAFSTLPMPIPASPDLKPPTKRLASTAFEPQEYSSPAFLKRAKVSYGSLFEGGFDIFNEEEEPKKKPKQRSRFSMNVSNWKYSSRSPSPEVEEEAEAESEPAKEPAKEGNNDLPKPSPRPAMVDGGCQTNDVDFTPMNSVQVVAESRSIPPFDPSTPTPLPRTKPPQTETDEQDHVPNFGFQSTAEPDATSIPFSAAGYCSTDAPASFDFAASHSALYPSLATTAAVPQHDNGGTYGAPQLIRSEDYPAQYLVGQDLPPTTMDVDSEIRPGGDGMGSQRMDQANEPFEGEPALYQPYPPIPQPTHDLRNLEMPSNPFSFTGTEYSAANPMEILDSSSPVRGRSLSHEPQSPLEQQRARLEQRLDEGAKFEEQLIEEQNARSPSDGEGEGDYEDGGDEPGDDYDLRNYDRAHQDDDDQQTSEEEHSSSDAELQVLSPEGEEEAIEDEEEDEEGENEEGEEETMAKEEDVKLKEKGMIGNVEVEDENDEDEDEDEEEEEEEDEDEGSEDESVEGTRERGEYENDSDYYEDDEQYDDEDEYGEEDGMEEEDGEELASRRPAPPAEPVFISLLSDSEDEDEPEPRPVVQPVSKPREDPEPMAQHEEKAEPVMEVGPVHASSNIEAEHGIISAPRSPAENPEPENLRDAMDVDEVRKSDDDNDVVPMNVENVHEHEEVSEKMDTQKAEAVHRPLVNHTIEAKVAQADISMENISENEDDTRDSQAYANSEKPSDDDPEPQIDDQVQEAQASVDVAKLPEVVQEESESAVGMALKVSIIERPVEVPSREDEVVDEESDSPPAIATPRKASPAPEAAEVAPICKGISPQESFVDTQTSSATQISTQALDQETAGPSFTEEMVDEQHADKMEQHQPPTLELVKDGEKEVQQVAQAESESSQHAEVAEPESDTDDECQSSPPSPVEDFHPAVEDQDQEREPELQETAAETSTTVETEQRQGQNQRQDSDLDSDQDQGQDSEVQETTREVSVLDDTDEMSIVEEQHASEPDEDYAVEQDDDDEAAEAQMLADFMQSSPVRRDPPTVPATKRSLEATEDAESPSVVKSLRSRGHEKTDSTDSNMEANPPQTRAVARSSEDIADSVASGSFQFRVTRSMVDPSDPSILFARSPSLAPPSEDASVASPTGSFQVARSKPDYSDVDPSVRLAQSSSVPSAAEESPVGSFRVTRSMTDHTDPSVLLATAGAPSTRSTRYETPETRPSSRGLQNWASPEALHTSPSVAGSITHDNESASAAKLQLLKSLRISLPDFLPLRSLRNSLNMTADILAVATTTPSQPHRPKHGPRDYMLTLSLTDPSKSTGVIVANIFRPHQTSLPVVSEGDIVLLRRFKVVSMKGRGFGIRAGDASSWAVFEKKDEEMLPQIKGAPVEVTDDEFKYAEGLRRWWNLLDEKAMDKIDRASRKVSEAAKEDLK